MTRSAVITLALAAALVVGIALLLRYADPVAFADAVADYYDDGFCFVCRRPLQSGDDVGSLTTEPSRGLAHFACLADVYGPLTEERT